MRLKYFTDKDSGKSIAVNVENVKYVVDSSYGPMIHFVDSSVTTIDGNYLDIVAQLNAD